MSIESIFTTALIDYSMALQSRFGIASTVEYHPRCSWTKENTIGVFECLKDFKLIDAKTCKICNMALPNSIQFSCLVGRVVIKACKGLSINVFCILNPNYSEYNYIGCKLVYCGEIINQKRADQLGIDSRISKKLLKYCYSAKNKNVYDLFASLVHSVGGKILEPF